MIEYEIAKDIIQSGAKLGWDDEKIRKCLREAGAETILLSPFLCAVDRFLINACFFINAYGSDNEPVQSIDYLAITREVV